MKMTLLLLQERRLGQEWDRWARDSAWEGLWRAFSLLFLSFVSFDRSWIPIAYVRKRGTSFRLARLSYLDLEAVALSTFEAHVHQISLSIVNTTKNQHGPYQSLILSYARSRS